MWRLRAQPLLAGGGKLTRRCELIDGASRARGGPGTTPFGPFSHKAGRHPISVRTIRRRANCPLLSSASTAGEDDFDGPSRRSGSAPPKSGLDKNTPTESTWQNRPPARRPPGIRRRARAAPRGKTPVRPSFLARIYRADDLAAEPRCPGGCLRRWRRTRIASLRTVPRSRTVIPHAASDEASRRTGRTVNTSQVINGKRVQIQRRRPFAIHIG
jgi:hypothetical protein